MKKLIRTLAFCLSVLLVFASFDATALATSNNTFENSISAFPESYKVRLRVLHKDHPNWQFKALITGLDWNTAVSEEQSYNRSLFPDSCTYLFKSSAEGDYNYSTGKYIQKDGGFVTANKAAVAYFMDPRNFLNDYGIFQFEDLSYDEIFDESAVEFVLYGTFMHNQTINYYNTKGKLVKTKEKYSTVICEAGKKANINPCYLASKIRGEIGAEGTSATSGKNKTYPGYYNFYNIGATDGVGAIERGLAWAADGTTYSRPWTSPQKSIIGGAEFIASTYIAKGQYTAYLQKFNVNPNGYYKVYDHQYMTNVCAASAQAYSSYDSYYYAKLLDQKYVFSIPVFKNMDDEKGNNGEIVLDDAQNQTGYIDCSGSYVRKGPSTNNERYDFMLSKGTAFEILDVVETDSTYYGNIINYPYWCKIKFTYDSKSYTGYVPLGFIALSSSVAVPLGLYEPAFSSKNGSTLHLVSFNEKVAEIQDDKFINFKKSGSAMIAAYDSIGRMSVAKYTVTSGGAPSTVVGISQDTTTATSYTLTWKKSETATAYTIYRYNPTTKTFKAIKTTTALSYTVKSKTPGSVDTYMIRSKREKDGVVSWGEYSEPFVAVTRPSAPTSITQSGTSSSGYTLSWKKVTNATGYAVYRYDTAKKKYVKIKTVYENKYVAASLSSAKSNKYIIRALIKSNGLNYYSGNSAEFSAVTAPKPVNKASISKVTETSYRLSWEKSSGATGYKIYRLNRSSGKYSAVATTTSTSYTFSKRSAGTLDEYRIKSYLKKDGKKFFSETPSTISVVTRPGKVSSLKQKATLQNGYTLKWNTVSGADGYVVYRYDAAKKKYVKLKTVKTNSLVIADRKTSQKDKYQVRAFKKLNGKTYYGEYSNVLTATSLPTTPRGLSVQSVSKKTYTIKWKKVANADGYKIYRFDEAKNQYVKIASTKSRTLTIESLKGDKQDKIAVRAYIKQNGTVYHSPYSKTLSIKLK